MRTLELDETEKGQIPNFTFNDTLDNVLDVLRVMGGIACQEDTILSEGGDVILGTDGERDGELEAKFLLRHRLDNERHVEGGAIISEVIGH